MIIEQISGVATVVYKNERYTRVRTNEFRVAWYYVERDGELNQWHSEKPEDEELERAFQSQFDQAEA